MYCKVCNCLVPQMGERMHSEGKKHLALLPKQIQIKGTFKQSDMSQLNEYFAKYGCILTSKFEINDDFSMVTYVFSTKTSYDAIIHGEHTFNGDPLTVLWRRGCVQGYIPSITPPEKTEKEEVEQIPYEGLDKEEDIAVLELDKPDEDREDLEQALVIKLQNCSDFTDQTKMLASILKADEEKISQKRRLIYVDLMDALASLSRNRRIHFFGSSVTGLGFGNSDVDVFVDGVRGPHEKQTNALRKIRTLIFKCRKFCDVLLISNAKVPLVKCIHTRTQICCDINVNNTLSVANSELIKYYISLDEKLLDLMLNLKYWKQSWGFGSAQFMPSYTFCLLVIFYLQQEPYNLPPVHILQCTVIENFVAGWNCSFDKSFSGDLTKLKEASMFELFKGFFKFYSNFDYFSNVICPFYGKPLKKIDFVVPCDQLPDCLKHYKNTAISEETKLKVGSPFCVQDPFELNRNVATTPTIYSIGKVVCAFRTTAILLEQSQSLAEIIEKAKLNPLAYKKRQDFNVHKTTPDIPNEQWAESAKNLVLKVLQDICDISHTIVNTKLHPETSALSYLCNGNRNVWEDRPEIEKMMETKLPSGVNEIDRESAVTKCVLFHNRRLAPFRFSISMGFFENPSRLRIIMECQFQKCKCFHQVANFLFTKLPAYIKIMEQMKHEDFSAEISLAVDQVCSSFPKEQKDKITLVDTTKSNMAEQARIVRQELNDITTLPAENVEVNTENLAEGTEDAMNSREDGELEDEEDKVSSEVDEEDVPADFFDDFANEDFMEGLDIVDAWDDDVMENDDGTKKKDLQNSSPEKRKRVESDDSKTSKSPKKRRRGRIPSKERDRRSRSDSRRDSEKQRRDPEKTRRDINRDKASKTKDKEQKLVTDKLRLVETGLVPPGTEMDVVDVSSVLKPKKGDSPEKVKQTTRKSPVRDRHYSRSPHHRSKERRRRRSGSQYSEREMWIRGRRVSSHTRKSPARYKKRSHNSRSRSRRRTRSRSRDTPLRTMARKYEEKKNEAKMIKKKTFLEEIREKLKEVGHPLPIPVPYMQNPQHPIMSYTNPEPPKEMHPICAPLNHFYPQIPHPVVAPVQPPQLQQYDQSFFIGEQFTPTNVSMNPMNSHSAVHNIATVIPAHAAMNMQAGNMRPRPQGNLALPSIIQDVVNKANMRFSVQDSNKNKEAAADLDKLFADKKISLSDFLTITAKPEVHSSSPDHVKKKIKIISRCQDAIKTMSDNRKFSGRLSVEENDDSAAKPCEKRASDETFESPLRRIPVVRFQFTTPVKASEENDSFAIALDKILQKVGLIQETVNLDDVPDLEGTKNKGQSSSRFMDEVDLVSKSSVMGRTGGKVMCDFCKKQKQKVFVQVGSQCVIVKETATIGTQVSEEDICPRPKYDSLAYMTPAQLLGKEKLGQDTVTPVSILQGAKKKANSGSPKKEMNRGRGFTAVQGGSPFRKATGGRGRGGAGGAGRGRLAQTQSIDYHEFNLGKPSFNFGTNNQPFQFQPSPSFGQQNRFHGQNDEDDELIDFSQDFTEPYQGRSPNPNSFGQRF